MRSIIVIHGRNFQSNFFKTFLLRASNSSLDLSLMRGYLSRRTSGTARDSTFSKSFFSSIELLLELTEGAMVVECEKMCCNGTVL